MLERVVLFLLLLITTKVALVVNTMILNNYLFVLVRFFVEIINYLFVIQKNHLKFKYFSYSSCLKFTNISNMKSWPQPFKLRYLVTLRLIDLLNQFLSSWITSIFMQNFQSGLVLDAPHIYDQSLTVLSNLVDNIFFATFCAQPIKSPSLK